MELSELTSYAKEKYNIEEQHKWDDFPGFSVLTDPHTGKWAALLMRGWDTDTGEMIERCDIKCGRAQIEITARPYITSPFRMHGPKWAGVIFGKETEAEIVRKLFDIAMEKGPSYGFTIVLDSPAVRGQVIAPENGDVPIPQRAYANTLPAAAQAGREIVPERIRKLRLMFRRDVYSMKNIAADFYRQGMFMRDYEDDYPWKSSFSHFFPTYHYLTLPQLRGYFSWRTRLRKGEFTPISTSAAYIYLYELLNGIGVSSVEERLLKMKEFDNGFIDAGYGDKQMKATLYRWMAEISVLNGMSEEVIKECAQRTTYKEYFDLSILHSPEDFTDEEVYCALSAFDPEKRLAEGIFSSFGNRAFFLVSETWRIAVRNYKADGKTLFEQCFGKRGRQRWYPLANAIYCLRDPQPDREIVLGSACSFICENKTWYIDSYNKLYFDKNVIKRFLHAVDLKLRKYLKAGAKLHEKPGEEWVYPFVDEAVSKDMRLEAERRRDSIKVDLSGLDKIRADAEKTRDSLLTEEDKFEELPEAAAAAAPDKIVSVAGSEAAFEPDIAVPGSSGTLPSLLDPAEFDIVLALLRSDDPSPILKDHRMLPELAADSINEALFDEFGDNVILCEDGHLSLVNEYAEDLQLMLENN